jgi:hypothetical protein
VKTNKEWRNTGRSTRYKFLFSALIVILSSFGLVFQKYSFTASIIVTALVSIPVFIFAFAHKIALRVIVDMNKKELTVEYLRRFAFTKTVLTVPLSQTQIQTTQNEDARQHSIDIHPSYYSVYLINKGFGELMISGQDFNDIRGIVETFTELRTTTRRRIRRRRVFR